jgi:hypothetical protein
MLLPIGMYDLALVQGDVTLRTGLEGEEYPGIRKGPVHLAGRLGLFDAEGPFGSPTQRFRPDLRVGKYARGAGRDHGHGRIQPAGHDDNLELFGDIFSTHCQGQRKFAAVLGGTP